MTVEAVIKTLEHEDSIQGDLERVLILEQIWRKYNLKESDGETDKS